MTTDFFGMKNQDAPQDEEVDTSGWSQGHLQDGEVSRNKDRTATQGRYKDDCQDDKRTASRIEEHKGQAIGYGEIHGVMQGAHFAAGWL